MRKRFQFILTISLIIIFQLAFWSFTFLAKKYITDEIVEQVKNDNKVIGEQLIKILTQTGLTGIYQQTDTILQHVCDEIMLPNGGFICAIDTKGNLVAAPNLKPGMTMSFNPVLKDFNNDKSPYYPMSQFLKERIDRGIEDNHRDPEDVARHDVQRQTARRVVEDEDEHHTHDHHHLALLIELVRAPAGLGTRAAARHEPGLEHLRHAQQDR